MYKWILGIIGFYIFRLPGFFIGLFIGHQIDKNSFIKGVVGWVDLCDGNVKHTLEY